MFTVFDGPNQKVDEKKEQNNLLTLKVLDSSKLKMLNILKIGLNIPLIKRCWQSRTDV